MFKLNFLLLLAVFVSALHVVKNRVEIRKQDAIYAEANKEAIRLRQQYADVSYEYSEEIVLENIQNIVQSLNMYQAPSENLPDVEQ